MAEPVIDREMALRLLGSGQANLAGQAVNAPNRAAQLAAMEAAATQGQPMQPPPVQGAQSGPVAQPAQGGPVQVPPAQRPAEPSVLRRLADLLRGAGK